MTCKLCDATWHWCSSCSVDYDEEAAWSSGLCLDCFDKCGAMDVFNKKYLLEKEVDELVEKAIKERK